MLGLSFGEIILIAVLGLVVIGPERLPETARFLTHLFRRLRKQVNEVRDDISRDMQLEKMKGGLTLEGMKNLGREFSGMKRDTESAVREVMSAGDSPLTEKKTTPAPTTWPGAASAPAPAPAKTQPYSSRRGDSRLLDLLRNLPKEDEAEVCKLLRELARKSEMGESSPA